MNWPVALVRALILSLVCIAEPAAAALKGEYGFLSSAVLGPGEESAITDKIRLMAREYGVREFMIYDWFADYSTPVRGVEWKDAYFHRHTISLATLKAAIAAIHQSDGRAWAYVQAIAAEEQDLESPAKDIWKLRTAKGEWYWHPGGAHPRFPTYVANAAWARLMVARWAAPVRELGFDGIHWDTLGAIASNRVDEARGLHDFIATAHGLLGRFGLLQTYNPVDLNGWDRELIRAYCEFPYAEVWFPATERRLYRELEQPDMQGIRGVMAMYPTTQCPAGWSESRVIRTRHDEARQHGLVYLILGDGERRMRTEYWPDTVALTPDEQVLLRQHGQGGLKEPRSPDTP